MPAHYRAPGWFARNAFNPAVAFLTRHGLSILGSRVLAVRGGTTGAWRTTLVNLLDHRGQRYLVSARGEGQWVRILRGAGTGEQRAGQQSEAFRGREDSSDAAILAIAARHPAFEVLPVN
jgi:hypothetical protein